jgi:hypothetical protein
MIDDHVEFNFHKASEGVTGGTLLIDPAKISLRDAGRLLLTVLLQLRDSGPHTVRIGADAGFVRINIAPAVFRPKESLN